MMKIIFGSACLHRRRLIALHYIVESNMIQFGDKSIWGVSDWGLRNIDRRPQRRRVCVPPTTKASNLSYSFDVMARSTKPILTDNCLGYICDELKR
ncbi:hypothetical protein [Sphingobium sp. YR768]|uniref:hypothetical protein n=1 Tax=Sphingobium sp. YR768 TaxID=1884365 RepID=UPI00115F9D93|nr:hypothetical protein [Sphingobium sp. YR768]